MGQQVFVVRTHIFMVSLYVFESDPDFSVPSPNPVDSVYKGIQSFLFLLSNSAGPGVSNTDAKWYL